MNDPLPPDPYKALGLTRDATIQQIKTAYKKAALRCHPDKAADKDKAADEFHRVNQAYETLVDDDKRRQYEDQVRLSQLRRDVYERRGAAPAGRSPNVDVRSPSGSSAYPSKTPPSASSPFASSYSRFDDRRAPHSHFQDDDGFDGRFGTRGYFDPDDFRASSRKYDGYTASPRQSPRPSPRPTFARSPSTYEAPRMPAEKPTPKTKERAAATKQRDRDMRQARSRKYSLDASDSEGSADELHRIRAERERVRAQQDDVRRRSDAVRSRSGEQRDERARKMSQQEAEIRAYTGRERRLSGDSPNVPSPPPSYRTQAFAEDNLPRKSPTVEVRGGRPSFFRRSSSSKTKSKEPPPSAARPRSTGKETSSRRGSRDPDVEERHHSADERRVPPPYASQSTPAGEKVPKSGSRRATYDYDDYDDPKDSKPHPGMKRSATMPTRSPVPERPSSSRATSQQQSSSQHKSRRSETAPSNSTPLHGSSGLRHYETNDSGYSTSSPSETPPLDMPSKSKTTTYRFNSGSDDEVEAFMAGASAGFQGSGVRAEVRRPSTAAGGSRMSRNNSPSPERPHLHARTSSNAGKHAGYERDGHNRGGPPLSRSAGWKEAEREREREDKATPTSSRRPSISRTNSGSKPRDLPRAKTMPPPINTKNLGLGIGGSGMLFGEVTASPTEMKGSGGEDSGRERDSGREAKSGRSSRRASEDVRPSRAGAPTSATASGSRYAEKEKAARAHMAESLREREREGGGRQKARREPVYGY